MPQEKSKDRQGKKTEKKKARVAKAIAFCSDDPEVCCVGGIRLSEAMEDALSGRDHVVMCRVNDTTLESIDALVEAGLCDSRSTAGAFLIQEGIKADAHLFNRIRDVTQQIAALKSDLRRLIEPVLRESQEERSKEGEKQ
jgi:hypothetical protein